VILHRIEQFCHRMRDGQRALSAVLESAMPRMEIKAHRDDKE